MKTKSMHRMTRVMGASAAAAALLFQTSAARADISCDTDCQAMCEDKFPRWYQGPDRERCALACFDTRPSCMPASEDLSRFSATTTSYESRLAATFVKNGYVVSLAADGSIDHVGDSVLWSSIAMAILPCDQGDAMERAVTQSMTARSGAVVRFEPLPASYANNVTSRDMETGAMFGFAVRAARCAGSRPALASAWGLHLGFIAKSGGHELFPITSPTTQTHYVISPGLGFLQDAVGDELGVASAPGGISKATFESSLVATVEGIRADSSAACYPAHLSTLQAVAAEYAGRPIKRRVYDDLCDATRSMDLPLTDWYCRRRDAASYLASYVPNQYEYRHQRCGSRESPDMNAGEQSPGLDYLIMRTLGDRR